jgi:hypothetical protein
MNRSILFVLVVFILGVANIARAEDDPCPNCNPDSCSCLHDDEMGDFCLCLLAPDASGAFQGILTNSSTGGHIPVTLTITSTMISVTCHKDISVTLRKDPAKIKTMTASSSVVQKVHYPKGFCNKAGFESIKFTSGSYNSKTGQFGGFTLHVVTTPLKHGLPGATQSK